MFFSAMKTLSRMMMLRAMWLWVGRSTPMETFRSTMQSDLDHVADHVAAEDGVSHAAVDRPSVLHFAHHAVDQVLLDQQVLPAARDAAVRCVVNLVAVQVQALLLPVGRAVGW